MKQLNVDLIYTYTRSLSIEAMPMKAEPIILDRTTDIATKVKIDKIPQENDSHDFYSVALLVKLSRKECIVEVHYVGVFNVSKKHSAQEKSYIINKIAPNMLLSYLNAMLHSVLPMSGISSVNISNTNFKFPSDTKTTAK